MQINIRRYASVTSTMDIARDLAEHGATGGIIVVADEQTAGRGRSGHAWYSPAGESLYLSVVLRPDLPPAQASWITMIAALATRETLRQYAPPEVEVSIKWFNDLLMRGRKVCGILVEAAFTGECVDYSILGIGLNVNTRFDDAPADVRARATSLWAVCQQGQSDAVPPLDREAILQSLLARFAERYAGLLERRASPAAEYTQHVETLGRDVRVDVGSGTVNGRATRIAEDGALIVQTAGGERRVEFGEVI